VQPVLHTLEREPIDSSPPQQVHRSRSRRRSASAPAASQRAHPPTPASRARRPAPSLAAAGADLRTERREQQRDQCPQRLHSVARLELVERVPVAIEQVPRRRRKVDRVIDDARPTRRRARACRRAAAPPATRARAAAGQARGARFSARESLPHRSSSTCPQSMQKIGGRDTSELTKFAPPPRDPLPGR
jgi:hypothetical protein